MLVYIYMSYLYEMRLSQEVLEISFCKPSFSGATFEWDARRIVYDFCTYFLTIISSHSPVLALIPKAKPRLCNEFDKCRPICPSQMCNELQKVKQIGHRDGIVYSLYGLLARMDSDVSLFTRNFVSRPIVHHLPALHVGNRHTKLMTMRIIFILPFTIYMHLFMKLKMQNNV
jgi:hypothetical protein